MPDDPRKQVALSVQDRTVETFMEEAPLVFFFAQLGDELPETPGKERDAALDKFWKSEPILSGAIYSMIAKVAALDFRLIGRQKAVTRYKNVLMSADFGAGWVTFCQKIVQDLLCSDNGAFIELLRAKGAGPNSPVLGVAHLDSSRCRRTNDPEYPVVYTSRNYRTKARKLEWWRVLAMADMPSPREELRGQGLCAVSRVLRAAQLVRQIGLYKRQKLSGKRIPAVLFVQGARRGAVKQALEEALEEQRSVGDTSYTGPVILASPDPGLPLEAKLIELAGLPDGYDEDVTLKWYIATLALGFGTDYTEFAPLPGGGMGSGSQTTEMAARARGKGPGVLLQQLEFGINWFVLPSSVTFQFASTDPTAEQQRIELAHARARERALRIQSQEITPEQGLILAVQAGDAPDAFLQQPDTDPYDQQVDVMVKSLHDLQRAVEWVETRLTYGS